MNEPAPTAPLRDVDKDLDHERLLASSLCKGRLSNDDIDSWLAQLMGLTDFEVKAPARMLVDKIKGERGELLNRVEVGLPVKRPRFLPEEAMFRICDRAADFFSKQPIVVPVSKPVTVVGDIHGQVHDLLELFNITGMPPETSFLFLGDYVDRGYFSVESVTIVLLLMLRHPQCVTILRGNHEGRHITQVYGFYDEVIEKYGNANVWKRLTDLFDFLPISAVVDNSIFADHGGLSPDLLTLDDIRHCNHFADFNLEGGPLSDLLWSDPDNHEGWNPSTRGAGYMFGPDVSEAFCHCNGLKMICRAHQWVDAGFEHTHDERVVTVFSAPNYCYRCGNHAAIMELGDDEEPTFIRFNTAPRRGQVDLVNRPPDYFL